MARTIASLPAGSRITGDISLGVIALALYMRSSCREVPRCLLEGVRWLPDPPVNVKVAGKSGASQARSRLGAEPLKSLYKTVVTPIARRETSRLVQTVASAQPGRKHSGCG
jgi:hypothetical protein